MNQKEIEQKAEALVEKYKVFSRSRICGIYDQETHNKSSRKCAIKEQERVIEEFNQEKEYYSNLLKLNDKLWDMGHVQFVVNRYVKKIKYQNRILKALKEL
jgi:hypothetical protein